MKFGVQIENHLGVTYNGVRKIALEAEKSGFDGLFICDHLMGRNEETFRQPCLDSWVTLGALAQATKKITLGTLVSAVGFRYPSLLAKMGATLDHVSGGRLMLTVGGGLARAGVQGVRYPVSTGWRTDGAVARGRSDHKINVDPRPTNI